MVGESQHVTNPVPVSSRKGEIGEEILDMLLSFSDFLVFKETMLDYRAVSGWPHTTPSTHTHTRTRTHTHRKRRGGT